MSWICPIKQALVQILTGLYHYVLTKLSINRTRGHYLLHRHRMDFLL